MDSLLSLEALILMSFVTLVDFISLSKFGFFEIFKLVLLLILTFDRFLTGDCVVIINGRTFLALCFTLLGVTGSF